MDLVAAVHVTVLPTRPLVTIPLGVNDPEDGLDHSLLQILVVQGQLGDPVVYCRGLLTVLIHLLRIKTLSVGVQAIGRKHYVRL